MSRLVCDDNTISLAVCKRGQESKVPSMRISRWWPCILPQDLGKYKNFIRYYPAEEQLLARQNLSDEISYRDLTIYYNEVQMLLNIDTVSVPEPQLCAVKEVEDLTDNFQEITISNTHIYIYKIQSRPYWTPYETKLPKII